MSLDLLERYKKDFKETMSEAKERMKIDFVCGGKKVYVHLYNECSARASMHPLLLSVCVYL